MMMMEAEYERRRRSKGFVQAVINMYGQKMVAMRKTETDLQEKRHSRAKEVHTVKNNIVEIDENRRRAEAVKAEAELELLKAKKTVKDLALILERSNLKKKQQECDFPEINDARRRGERRGMEDSKMENDNQYTEAMIELESAKHELDKLKLDIARVIEEKSRVEKEMDATISRTQSRLQSLKELSKEVEEANEEHVLVELARIEANKELADVETQRKQEHHKFSLSIEEKRKQISIAKEGIPRVIELETALEATNSEIGVLQNELNFIKEMENISTTRTDVCSNDEDEVPAELNAVQEELETLKLESEFLRQEGRQTMASMDITMKELEITLQEGNLWKLQEQKQKRAIKKLNSQLQRAREKLEAVDASEASTTAILSAMSESLDQMSTTSETAKGQVKLMATEIAIFQTDVKELDFETDLADARAQGFIDELQEAKASEAMAMEKLKVLTASTMRARALAANPGSTMTISKFEYEYLRGSAALAGEAADKKVEAAEAWIKALKKSEEEMLMEMEIAQKEVAEVTLKEDLELQKAEKSLTKKTIRRRRVEE